MILLVVMLLLLCTYWIYWMVATRRMDKLTKSLPMLPSLPFIGHGGLFIGNSQQILKNLWTIAQFAKKHKNSVKVWLGPKLYVVIADPQDALVVLENSLDKNEVYRFLHLWLGEGLFAAPVDLWKSYRKLLLPVFHNKVIEKYLAVINRQANVLTQRLEEQTDKGKFDILKYVTSCTLDIAFAPRTANSPGLEWSLLFTTCLECTQVSRTHPLGLANMNHLCTRFNHAIILETTMGERMDVQHSPDTEYLRARHIVMTILSMRFFKVWLQPDWIFNLTRYAKLLKDNISLTHKFTDEIVKRKRQEYKNSDLNVGQYYKLHSVLDLLLREKTELTNEQLREQIDSITVAGNDTTALVIAYTFVLLGIHQDVQEKVIQEQRSIFGTSTRAANKSDLHRMHYLERVIKESMRLYTVVPIIARSVHKDTFLPTCEVTVPAGAGAVVAAYAIHRSETAWGPEPHKFNPDRFLPENSLNRHPAAFLPFSYGSRNCIGRNFGMLIIKSIISSVVQRYEIKADDIGDLKVELLLFPTSGHQVKISKRIDF